MLNTCFPKDLVTEETKGYVLPRSVADQVYCANADFGNGPELRLQDVYREELWRKLQSLGFGPNWWNGKTVLDLCCGTGFLSYHLLARATPRHVTMLDISEKEVAEAKQLIASNYGDRSFDVKCANALDSGCASASFDVVIGNSFLHHFPDVGMALREFARVIKPEGYFVGLHEPKAAAIALESRNPTNWLAYARHGSDFVEKLRPAGTTLPPGTGTDVWLFDEGELRSLLTEAGFGTVRTEQWNFIRPLVVATATLFLSPDRPRLGLLGQGLLRAAVASDAILRELLPPACFASLAFSAQKPPG